MAADRPDDPDVPPDRRDHQPAHPQAETRTRQEYYAELRVTVAREEAAATRQATAQEQSTSEKWQQEVTEFRHLWSEHQRKWPPEDRPSREGNRSLDPADNSRVEAECDRIADREKDRITPALRAIESQDPDRHLIGFDQRLKGRDRIKEKVYDGIKLLKHSPEDAVSLVPDTIRYTFQYGESRYTQGVWTDIERLKGEFKLDKLKNYWTDDQYKGINSTWIDLDTGQRFEVQFHTRISYEAKQITHTAYERVRTRQADVFEELVLDAFQKKVSAEVPVPHGAVDIPDYPERG
jgi:hypothetical protein